VEIRWRSEELYEQHAPALVGFAASIVGSGEAEDIVASVAGRLFRSAAIETVANQKAFLYQAVLNEATRERIRQLSWDSTGPDLSVALDALSPRQRAVVHLTYWEELSGPEVARRLAISEGSVRKHLARAKKTMKELINDRQI